MENLKVQLKLKSGEFIMDDEEQDNHHHSNHHHHHNNHHHHLLCDNDQRTASMNSFADAHTPSESPEASSSESSAGGDWESGEFKTNDQHIDWPKQRKTSKTKFISNSNKSQTGKQTQQFKAKTNNIKIINNNNKETVKKMRWLTNMRSDPDFRETLAKSVNIQPRQSIDSLDTDFYSAICDNQLSVGSPCKSPSELLLKNNQLLNKNSNGKKQLEKQQQPQQQQPHQQQLQQQNMDTQSLQNSDHQTKLHPINCSELVIAKPTESQSIGFKLESNENHASAKHSHDKSCLLKQSKLKANDDPSPLKEAENKSLRVISTSSHEPHSDQYKKDKHSSQLNSSSQNTDIDASQSIDSHEKSSNNTKKNSKRKSNEQSFPYRFFHKSTTAHAAATKSTSAQNANTSVVATAVGVAAAAATVAAKPLKLKIYHNNENNNIMNGTKNTDSNSSIASTSTVSHSIDTVDSASSTCSSSHSSNSSGSSSSASNSNLCVSPSSPSTSIFSASRFNRCSPFTFREFREELRLVMRQNSTKTNTNSNNNNNSNKCSSNKQE